MEQNVMVFTGQMARQLLREGFTIVDIKPDKLDSDGKRSVFIFRNDEGLLPKMRELSIMNKGE